MTSITTAPHGDAIEIPLAYLKGVKADLVKEVIRITIDLPLDKESLALRSRLADLAREPDKSPITVQLQPLQHRLLRDGEIQMTFRARGVRPRVGPGGEVPMDGDEEGD